MGAACDLAHFVLPLAGVILRFSTERQKFVVALPLAQPGIHIKPASNVYIVWILSQTRDCCVEAFSDVHVVSTGFEEKRISLIAELIRFLCVENRSRHVLNICDLHAGINTYTFGPKIVEFAWLIGVAALETPG